MTRPRRNPKPEKAGAKPAWTKSLAEQVNAVHRALNESGCTTTADELSKNFKRANQERILEILDTLVARVKARATDDGRFQSV